MGSIFFDEFTLLHFATGIVAQYWSMPLWLWILVNIVYEWIENTKWGMHFITHNFKLWPGGKLESDTMVNRISDIFSGILGWLVAYWVRQ